MGALKGLRIDEESRMRRLAGLDTRLCFAEDAAGVVRPYRLFVPSGYQYAPAEPCGPSPPKFPLVVMLHGGGSADYPCDENWFFANRETPERPQTIAEERGYLVACPALPYMRLAPLDRDAIARTVRERDVPYIMNVVRDVVYNMHVDETRVFLVGASRGGLSMYCALDANAAKFAAAAAICSHPPAGVLDNIVKVPVLLIHAAEDQFFPIQQTRELSEAISARGGRAVLHEFPGVHDGLRRMEIFTLVFDWFDREGRRTAVPQSRLGRTNGE